MRPRWRVRVREDGAERALAGVGLFDEIAIGDWLHLEWMSGRFWWMQVGHARFEVNLRAGRAVDVEIDAEGCGPMPGLPPIRPILEGCPWSLRAYDRGELIELRGTGTFEEVYVKYWFHMERVGPGHVRLRVGDADVQVQVVQEQLRVEIRRGVHASIGS